MNNIMEGTRPTNLAEAEAHIVSDETREIRVSDVLDLEEILIVLERLGISSSLRKVLGNIESITATPDFDTEFQEDSDLQEILVSSLEKSIQEINQFSLKSKAVTRMGGNYPDGVRVRREDIDTDLNSPADISTSIQTILGLIHTHVATIEPLLNDQQASRLGVAKGAEAEVPEGRKDPFAMTINEIIDELSGKVIGTTERARELNNAYFDLIGKVEDKHLQAWYRVRRGIQAIMSAGDTGDAGAFDIVFDKINHELADKGVQYFHIARALFMKTPEKDGILTSEEMDAAEIDHEAMKVYDYIVKRIKHNKEYGGLDHDPDNPNPNIDDEESPDYDPDAGREYSYYGLAGDNSGNFEKHLARKFADIEPPEKLAEIIKYAQAMAAKSAGYIPWLLRAATRAHGIGLDPDTFRDELFVAAPFAADQYSRTRYGDNRANSTTEDIYFINKKDLPLMVEGKYENGVWMVNKDKKHSLEHLWELVEQYRDACYDTLPEWVKKTRDLMMTTEGGEVAPEDKLDLNSSWFPLPGEVTPNILKVEQRRRDIIGMPDGVAKDAAKKEFLKYTTSQGYGSNLEDQGGKKQDIGLPQLTKLTPKQYELSYDAMEKFNKAFREMPTYMDKHQCLEAFYTWMKDVVGKAKLVPGKHHLLFGPFTVRMIYKIVRSYELSHEATEVEELLAELIKEMNAAGGLPSPTKKYVSDELGFGADGKKTSAFNFSSEMVRYVYPLKRRSYEGALWRHHNENPTAIKKKFANLLPMNFGKGVIEFEAPWDWDHVDENTGGGG
jgi:hypothetical protein